MKYLVVVESPSKCAKIKKMLENSFPNHSFNVLASVGHFMCLSKKKMGVDIKNNFKPDFIQSSDKRKVISSLKSAAKKVDKVIIATDLDAEGEKIGYDIAKLLKLDLNDNNRIIFNEITQSAIKEAFENPIKVNMDLVHSQFARRILDRLIGFEISRITAKGIQRGCSAGRVLSVTTKIIYDKEKELRSRKKDTFLQITGDFKNKYTLNEMVFKQQYKKEKEVEDLFENFKPSTFKISKVSTIEKNSSPPLPFITSTINQASPYGIRQTTGILQKLYQKGAITYIRTDSTKMSEAAKDMMKNHITSKFGGEMFQYRKFNTKKVKGAQEAHECIRPTKIDKKFEDIKNLQERKIYELIWKRSVACLMKDSKYLSKDIKVLPSNIKTTFNKTMNKYTFLGWRTLYTDLNEINKETNNFEEIKEGDELKYVNIKSIQKYNSTKGRYNESKLVQTLEKIGIGRPSTYATAVSNIQNKLYVKKDNVEGEKVNSSLILLKNDGIFKTYFEEIINAEKNKLLITELGKRVTDFLEEKFDVIMNYNFTSDIEADLDRIQNNEVDWFVVVEKYYNQFHPQVVENKEMQKKNKKKDNKLIGEYKGKNFYRFQSQWGPRVIYGEKGEKDTLYLTPIDQVLLDEITLEESISLLPISVGQYDGHDIILHYSKSLYIKWNRKNVPLHYTMKNKKKEDISLNNAIFCIQVFNEKKNKKKSFKKKKVKKVKSKTVVELKKEAKEKGIKGYSKMKKSELIKILK